MQKKKRRGIRCNPIPPFVSSIKRMLNRVLPKPHENFNHNLPLFECVGEFLYYLFQSKEGH